MDKAIARREYKHIVSVLLSVAICFLSVAVAIVSQFSAINYLKLLSFVLLFGVLPQLLLLRSFPSSSRRAPLLLVWTIAVISWLFVADLTVRVLAA